MAGLLVYSGKGGSGTTTCAAATARRFAQGGAKTALVSIDPKLSLSDAVGVDVGPEPTEIGPNLTGVEINPQAGQETFEACFDRLAATASVAGIDLADGHVSRLIEDAHVPFGREVAALEAVASFVGDADYDQVVFDTGLQGRVLRLLRKPGLLGQGVDAASMVATEVGDRVDRARRTVLDPLPGWRESGPAGAVADEPAAETVESAGPDGPTEADDEAIEARVATVRRVLGEEGRRELRVVTTPDRVDAQWTEHLVVNLRMAGLPTGPLVVNKVVEAGDCCARCAGRRRAHDDVLAGLREWEDLELRVLPDLHGDAAGEALLDRLADRLVG